MKRTIQELREDRGESRADLAATLGVTLDEVTAWELGRAQPRIARMRVLTEHFGVRDDQIRVDPGQPPSLADRLGDLL
jgi:ribosome-binding protein aMBF1 (putative translation factor)